MEWREIENKWKETSRKKEVTPSANAWDRLSNELDRQQAPIKKKFDKRLLYVAACLCIGGYLLTQLLVEHQDVLTPSVAIENAVTDVTTEFIEETEKIDLIVEEPTVLVQSKEANQLMDKKGNRMLYKDIIAEKKVVKQEVVADVDKPTSDIIIDNVQEIASHDVEQKGVVVESSDLLKQVEGEIVVEYRESVIKKIYDKTKKVVVDISNSRYEK